MPAFSFSAPSISVEQEQAERAALSETDRAQIQLDLYGPRTTSLDETGTNTIDLEAEITRRGIEIMHETIQFNIPDNEKIAFLTAQETCPDLVANESSLSTFLQCENNDPWAASKRLVQYWSMRRELFGSKCYLPLRLNDGAMADDLDYLSKGIIYIMAPDIHGRLVIFFDRVRCTPRVIPQESLLRCSFYTMCVAATIVNQQLRRAKYASRTEGHQLVLARFGMILLSNLRVGLPFMCSSATPT
jgi:hypothetical protein